MLFHMSQGNIFVYIQRCHNQCWLDKLCISFDNSLVKDKYLYYSSCSCLYTIICKCLYINYASEYISISKCDIDVINHARKSLLFDGSNTWIKKQGGLFDVSMGAYDGAEVCELVGTYMLNVLSKKIQQKRFRAL